MPRLCQKFVLSIAVSALDECDSPTILGDLAKRSPNYIQDAVPLCDRYLVEKWYVAVQHKMPTIAPDLGSCGTTYPVWLNGNEIKIRDVYCGIMITIGIFTFFTFILYLFYIWICFLTRWIACKSRRPGCRTTLSGRFWWSMFTQLFNKRKKLRDFLCLSTTSSWYLPVSLLFW